MKAYWRKVILNFHKPAGTSRGVLIHKPAYFILLQNNENGFTGIGECGLLPGLSADDRPGYEDKLDEIVRTLEANEPLPELATWPSLALGLEMAQRNLACATEGVIAPTAFTEGKAGIPINGLVWMGTAQDMSLQIDEKLKAGFACIKLKIGAIDFDEELRLLAHIRKSYPPDVVEIRVDANGAFNPDEACRKIDRLAKYRLHSIEQPIRKGQWEQMAKLCAGSELPIALDEELIGLHDTASRREMIDTIKPQGIVLKPSFLGNFAVSDEWIDLAEEHGAIWWITSALESNVGLNAIAQYTYTRLNEQYQGLGTGLLYSNNFECPLDIDRGLLYYRPEKGWNLSTLL